MNLEKEDIDLYDYQARIEQLVGSKQYDSEFFELFKPVNSSFYHSHPTPKVFRNTHLLQEAARTKDKTGKYCPYPPSSRKYNDYWAIQDERIANGYTINKGTEYELSITGYHYFHLNFTKMQIVLESDTKKTEREEEFPRFWQIHYDFFWAFEECIKAGEHIAIVKPRGTGFSQIFSSVVMKNFSTIRNEKNFIYCAMDDALYSNDGILTKCWDKLNYLNSETEDGLKQLTQGSKTTHRKRASFFDDKIEKGLKSEIIGNVISKPANARGPRAMFIGFEEAGSFPMLKDCIAVARPSVEQGGYVFGTIAAWGTGGEIGKGIEGLQSAFYKPSLYNMRAFANHFDEDRIGTPCGFFFPAYYCRDRHMDQDGNMDQLAAYIELYGERLKIKEDSSDARDVDRTVAEFPFTPGEAFQRVSKSIFPRTLIQTRINRIEMNSLWKHWSNGYLEKDDNGKVQFILDPKARPILQYPITPDTLGVTSTSLEGCISIAQPPRRDEFGNVYRNLYSLSVDPYAQDQSEHSNSIGSVYVIKRSNNIIERDSFDNNIVASYNGRPANTDIFWDNVFLLAEFYGCKVQSEIVGGGSLGIARARVKKKLSLLAPRVEVADNKETKTSKTANYFMKVTTDMKNNGLMYLVQWLLEEVGGTEDAVYKIRLDDITDVGFLRECFNFVDEDGHNFDRISSMIVQMWELKEAYDKPVREHKQKSISELLKSETWYGK
jgi:hypothetical protein